MLRLTLSLIAVEFLANEHIPVAFQNRGFLLLFEHFALKQDFIFGALSCSTGGILQCLVSERQIIFIFPVLGCLDPCKL